MKPWTGWIDWTSAALGLYMMFAAEFTVDVTDGLSSWLSVLLGAWIMMLALVALGYPGARRSRIASAVLGLALLSAPWVFGYADSGAAASNAWAVGTLVMLVSISGQLRLRQTRALLEARGLRLTPEGDVVPASAEARDDHDAIRASEPSAEVAEELLTWVALHDPSEPVDDGPASPRDEVRAAC
jgi:hypothetical protein